jgi:hypothetical protein
MTAIAVTDLTQSTLDGTGVFDVLMRATKAHLEAEYNKNRIKGAEYATVYLGSLEPVLRTSLDFLLQKQKIALEAQLLEQQIILAGVEVLKANAQVALMEQQTINAGIEATVLQAQKCKLDAEYDLILGQVLKTTTENALLTQKVVTEKAQTSSVGIDGDSVIGKQKALYHAQTEGFARDAEQKTAKLLADTWNVRRTTDEGTVADSTNMLNDATVGRAINKMLAGVGA